jgi:hypothetical protein
MLHNELVPEGSSATFAGFSPALWSESAKNAAESDKLTAFLLRMRGLATGINE